MIKAQLIHERTRSQRAGYLITGTDCEGMFQLCRLLARESRHTSGGQNENDAASAHLENCHGGAAITCGMKLGPGRTRRVGRIPRR